MMQSARQTVERYTDRLSPRTVGTVELFADGGRVRGIWCPEEVPESAMLAWWRASWRYVSARLGQPLCPPFTPRNWFDEEALAWRPLAGRRTA